MSFLEQAIKMPEFWFYLIPKPYKNIFFFQICFRLLKVEDMAFDNDEVYLSPVLPESSDG